MRRSYTTLALIVAATLAWATSFFNNPKSRENMPESIDFAMQSEDNVDYEPMFKPAPYFEFTDINPNSPTHEQTVSIDDYFEGGEQYNGKPTILNIWDVYCGPCIEEMPIFQDLQDDYNVILLAARADTVFLEPSTLYSTSENYEIYLKDWGSERFQERTAIIRERLGEFDGPMSGHYEDKKELNHLITWSGEFNEKGTGCMPKTFIISPSGYMLGNYEGIIHIEELE